MSVRQHTYETKRVTCQSLIEESISEPTHRRFSFFGVTFFYAVVPLFHSSSDALMSHLQEQISNKGFRGVTNERSIKSDAAN